MTDVDVRTHARGETILFGAFDRHNFGDMLFPHVLARMLPGRKIRFAGLRERDLRPYGGHSVEAIATLASGYADQACDIVHVGGELLTCDAWEAAVMLSPPGQAMPMIEAHSAWMKTPAGWAKAHLGLATRAPYVLSKAHFAQAHRIIFNAIGGVGLEHRDPTMVAEVVDALRQADDVSVRDAITQRALLDTGITARLLPDPAVMTAELFGDTIGERAACEAVGSIRDTFPNGYIAVQFSADFGDDRTLDIIAAQLDVVAAKHGLGVAFFRAGIAPWHDDSDVYDRTRQRMRTARATIMASPNIWDICALIASSRAYCGSSLHGRIVAAAFALPRVNLYHPARAAGPSKQASFAAAWEGVDVPGEAGIGDMARGIDEAFEVGQPRLQRIASTLVSAYRSGFERVAALLA
jgi:hypothetical protein